MKRLLSFLALGIAALGLHAQTFNIVAGGVTYAIPASEAGTMTYTDGTKLTVCGKTFTISDITSAYVDGSTVTENAVNVVYDGTSATATVPYNIMADVEVSITGADVVIEQGSGVSKEITYTLSGTSSSGSLYMDGSLKATFVLNGLNLTNPNGAAINIRDGKRINMVLTDGTTNTLADGSGGDWKACLMVKGHTEFDGTGTLNITGKTAHGFWGKEYVQLKKGAGTINILGAVKDGFNVNQYFQQNGGTVSVKNVGDDGIQVSYKTDDNDKKIPLTEDADNTGEFLFKGGTLNIAVTAAGAKGIKAEGPITFNEEKNTTGVTISTTGGVLIESNDSSTACCIKSDTIVTIEAGTFQLTSSGQGSRCIRSSYDMFFNGGTVTARASGTNLGSSGGGGWGPGGGGWGSSSNHKYAKCIKANRNITFAGTNVNAYSANHEAIESKGVMTFEDGIVYAQGGDDAINSAGNMYIKGGYVYGYSSSNDGIDANGNMYISGGVAIGFGAGGAESGIDIGERQYLYITGGQVFGIGGRVDATISSTGTTQAYGYNSRSASFSNQYIVLTDNSNNPIFAVKAPTSSYSGIALVSSPSMSKSTTYKLRRASSVSGTETNGFYLSPTVSSATDVTSFTSR